MILNVILNEHKKLNTITKHPEKDVQAILANGVWFNGTRYVDRYWAILKNGKTYDCYGSIEEQYIKMQQHQLREYQYRMMFKWS